MRFGRQGGVATVPEMLRAAEGEIARLHNVLTVTGTLDRDEVTRVIDTLMEATERWERLGQPRPPGAGIEGGTHAVVHERGPLAVVRGGSTA